MKSLLKKLIPSSLLSAYHYYLARFAAFWYGHPSNKLIVIGITGTKGKTTTANFIWSVLNSNGLSCGLIGTANIRLGQEERMNKYHMTMPGRFVTQKLLREMVKKGCQYAVLEVTSEGVKQWRHQGINYDMAIFTNLTPEHLPSHGGSFEEYKKAKGIFFATLAERPSEERGSTQHSSANVRKYKIIKGIKIEKTIIANADSPHADYFLNFRADKKITYSVEGHANYIAKSINSTDVGVEFFVNPTVYKINILGAFNVYNAMPAVIVGYEAELGSEQIQKGLMSLKIIPGRMEKIEEGQDFTLLVDYAHEKESMTAVLNTAKELIQKNAKIIILLGAEGGGRDKAKRPIMGELSARMADYVIVSNVDPYEDDPKPILEDIATACENPPGCGYKVRGEKLFVIEDRRECIQKALSLAKTGDVVLITGKGAEQSITIGGKSSPWDDRLVVREELKKVLEN